MNIDDIAIELCKQSLSAGHSEKIVSKLEENNHYKVCYRFLSNMLSQWRELGFEHFPSKDEAVVVAKKAHQYFVWALSDLNKLDEFYRLYEFHEDVWINY